MISICMITRDNEDTLERCLASVAGLGDELIIADTGSCDSTKEIARRFTSKIFDFPWTNNFSDAKNFTIARASQGWILAIDADETISVRDHPRIRTLCESETYLGYYLVQRNYTNRSDSFCWVSCRDDVYDESRVSSGYVPRNMLRLFRNDSRIRFEGAVHDTVAVSIERICADLTQATDIPIHHFGLLNRSPDRILKYIEMEKQHLRNDPFQEYQIGSQYHTIGNLGMAREHLERSVNLNPDFTLALTELGVVLIKQGDPERARDMLVRSLQKSPQETAWDHLGIAVAMMGKLEEAIECFRNALALNGLNANIHYNLAQTLRLRGNIEEAKDAYRRAVHLDPGFASRIPEE